MSNDFLYPGHTPSAGPCVTETRRNEGASPLFFLAAFESFFDAISSTYKQIFLFKKNRKILFSCLEHKFLFEIKILHTQKSHW
uniref:Uncharacterized protein n=1 Tax=Arundo donax TaxID=35708 RepID=A0A0A9H3C5_ARUDO